MEGFETMLEYTGKSVRYAVVSSALAILTTLTFSVDPSSDILT